jgi:hypothetical protein
MKSTVIFPFFDWLLSLEEKMKKCISCASELPLQARFCRMCGAIQPIEKGVDEIANENTMRDPMSVEDKAMLPTHSIPPPPPSQQNEEDENKFYEFPPPQLWENKLGDTGSTGQSGSQWHSTHSQPQQYHGEHLQPQQLHGTHLQPQQYHSEHLQPQQPYGVHSQPQQYHGEHLQPQQYHGVHSQPQQLHGPHQQPYHAYPQPQAAASHTTATIAKVGTTATKTGTTILGKWIIITAIATVVLGASGAGVALAFHPFNLFTTPHPVMKISSTYNNAQGKPVAASGTTLHISAQNFAANSPITFLLNNKPLNETRQTQSDGNGNVITDLAVTSEWKIGQDTLTAHDANNTTTGSTEIEVVQPGQSHTPGPHGAPADDASFTIQVEIQVRNSYGYSFSYPYTLTVTGHPDPAGGTVCSSRDNGTTDTQQDTQGQITGTYSCSGTYKGGNVSYIEAVKTQTLTFLTGETCTLRSPQQPYLEITGSYTSQDNFSGTAIQHAIDSSMYNCNPTDTIGSIIANTGTWTGTVSKS